MSAPRAVAAFLMIFGGTAIAQVAQPGAKPEDAKPQFEVASIRPSAPDERGMLIRPPSGGRVDITNTTLKRLVANAWGIQLFQISGGPGWLDSAHYDIAAKAGTTSNEEDIALMLQALLTDRFQLKIHRETRELPVYALILAKKDRRLGPGLTESKDGACTKADSTSFPARREPGKLPAVPCGRMMINPSFLRAASVPFASLTTGLARLLGRIVVDKTGLKGNFDIGMEWAPDEAQYLRLPPGVPAPPPSDGPSIFVAVQEQARTETRIAEGAGGGSGDRSS